MIIIILGAVAAYRLWGDITWLSVAVVLFALMYLSIHRDEPKDENNAAGWTSMLVIIIFIYSLFR